MHMSVLLFTQTYLLSKEINASERLHARYVKHTEEPMASPHVLGPHGTVFLLAGCVQDV